MKIGIFAGEIPPPVFITSLINGLVLEVDKLVLYGTPKKNKIEYIHKSVILNKFPVNKVEIMLKCSYLILLLIFNKNYSINILKEISSNSNSWISFYKRCCKILPTLLDGLDLLHIQWSKSIAEYPEIVENIKCPIVLSLRGSHINYSPLADINLAKKYKKYFPRILRFHAVSNVIAKKAQKYCSTANISIIKPAINKKLLNNKLSINKLKEKINIISIGRCHWIKGYTYALDVMHALRNDNIDFHYTIIANGKDDENLNFQINDLKLDGFVTFINGLPHKEVIKKLTQSDLLILPSFEEGISNSVLESMALGIPVISTNCGGMNEVIEDGVNGFIVPVRDVDQMSNTIKKIINMNEKQIIKMINNAKKSINDNHLISNQVEKFMLLYRSIIDL